MSFRTQNQDTNETNYDEYPMINYYPEAYRYSMLPCQNIDCPAISGYTPYNDNDVNNYKDGFRQYHNRPYRPYYHQYYNPYYYNPYYHHPYYHRPYYDYDYDFDYGYGVPFLAGLALGSFF